ncbi:MAG: acetolactate synthase large subunit [Acidimicrobiia bacterium]|nr:acetolactate synthase large subunit [Acidimicrobiia bacterium]MBT8192855.1 acetolactate synthase large subunit [Acidimicrobiia bacterium]MBT8247221.1 acetolactate synthase large subunit [Acidimicrobiia bacterium]NNF89090.1 acetolactate synthase large subunit [Acidimicrobiia bacterium]NNL14494.1 acetolactate synthase large subunit [Acidimicrobiia bacterium]
MKITVAEALIKALEFEGVEVMFGHPGGAILPAYDPLYDSPIRHILARHEQGAGHMAEGYAQATGRVGVAIATSGPGATNLVTSLANAYMDSTPMVAITGQVPTTAIGNDAFQEAHTWGISMPATKHNYLVTDPEDIPDVIHEAFHLARSGRPGPVLVDLPKNILNSEIEWHEPTGRVDLPGYKPNTKGHPLQIRAAVDLILEAERPVLYAGGGIIAAGAHAELLELAEKANLPVTTTLMARGAFPDTHPLSLGMPGMHGTYAAITAMQKADLLIAVGTRFDDRVTGDPDAFAPHARVIHADIDPSEIGKIRVAEVPIVGDARIVLEQLNRKIDKTLDGAAAPDHAAWLETIGDWQRDKVVHYEQDPAGPIKPQFVVEELYRITGGEAVVVAGVGQHQMWASQLWKYTKPRTWLNSGGLGTMGYAIPAAIGAKLGLPDQLIYAIDGDGCFQMTQQELTTASTEGIPIKIAVLNNNNLGMVRQWQRLFYNERFSATELTDHTPDFVKLAEAMGCVGLRAEHPSEVGPVIEKSLTINDRPVVVEFRVDPDEMVFPMVPAGGSNDVVAMSREDLE